MFDPSIGRWMEEDPEGFVAGDTNLYRYVGNSPTNYTDPSGLAEVKPGEMPSNPLLLPFILLPIVSFRYEISLIDRFLGEPARLTVLPDVLLIKNPIYNDLRDIRKQLDQDIPKTLKTFRAALRYKAVWVKVDADSISVDTDVEASGLFSDLYKNRARVELKKQADVFADIIKKQLLPSYYLAEDEEGFVKANAGKLEWKEAKFASKLFEAGANAIADKKLVLEHSEDVLNPFMLLRRGESMSVKLIFKTKVKIRTYVYYAELKK